MSNKNKTITAETIITSNINADFDAIASMLAAQKLYPEALVVFPGSQEKNLKNFFIKGRIRQCQNRIKKLATEILR